MRNNWQRQFWQKFLITAIFATTIVTAKARVASTIAGRPTAKATEINYSEKDLQIFESYIAKFKDSTHLEMRQLVTSTALHFLGTPYVAHTLEKEPERLTINLSQLDCTTFMESTIALALTIKSGNNTFEQFQKELQQLRYRKTPIEDYSDRIHYTSEWFAHNSTADRLSPIKTAEPIKFELNIISKNPERYRQLKGNPTLVKKIEATEKAASKIEHHYFSTAKLEKLLSTESKVTSSSDGAQTISSSHNSTLKSSLSSGSVVAFVTSIAGLDVTHVGFLYWQGEKLTFIHASSTQKKVVVESLSLLQYVQRGRNSRGIMVGKVLAP